MRSVSPLLTRLIAFRRPALDVLAFLKGFLNESALVSDEDFPLILSVNVAWFVTNAVRQNNSFCEDWVDNLVFEEALTDASTEFEEFVEEIALAIRQNPDQDWDGAVRAFFYSLENFIRYHARLHEPQGFQKQFSFSSTILS